MGILWTKAVNTALYYLPRGFAGGHILISLFQGLFKAHGYEGGWGVGIFEYQGGVVNIGWAYIFQGGVELSFVTMLLVDIF